MWRQTSKRVLCVVFAVLLLGGCRRSAPPQRPLPFVATTERAQEEGPPGVLYTVHVLQLAHEEHGLVEELWQYVNEDAPRGASPELRRRNNLRIGLLDDRFRASAADVLERMHTRQLAPIPTFCPAGKVQFFTCGRRRKQVSLFLWTAEDQVLGRSFPQLSLAVDIAVVPVHKGLAELIVTPAIVVEPKDRQRIQVLKTVTRCPVGSSLVVGGVDPQQPGLGKFFQSTVNNTDDREQLLIITLDAVRPEVSR